MNLSFNKLADDGAHSIYAYIERTAESLPEGVRWQTLNYHNQPHYGFIVFDGVSGISFFLADYYRITGDRKALELATDALRWCSLPEHQGYSRGLYVGKTGIGMAWLHLAKAANDPTLLEHCSAHAEILLREAPGPVNDILGGAAGNGLFLLRLWEATGTEQFLSGVKRNCRWLDEIAVRDGSGCYWKVGTEDKCSLGFAHGIAGIAYFLLVVFEATGDQQWAGLARETLQTLRNQAIPDRGGLNWMPVANVEGKPEKCQWCHGSPGVGLAFLKASSVLEDADYLKIAEAAGETTFAYGDARDNPSQCHGLSGNAELFIELYKVTREQIWLDRAFQFAELCFKHRKTTPEGDIWRGDDPGNYSQDFLTGAAGTGHFFLRLLHPDILHMPLS